MQRDIGLCDHESYHKMLDFELGLGGQHKYQSMSNLSPCSPISTPSTWIEGLHYISLTLNLLLKSIQFCS